MAFLKALQFIPTLLLAAGVVSARGEDPLPGAPPAALDKGIDRSVVPDAIWWYHSVDAAMQIAKSKGKMVFWYQIAGDLDQGAC